MGGDNGKRGSLSTFFLTLSSKKAVGAVLAMLTILYLLPDDNTKHFGSHSNYVSLYERISTASTVTNMFQSSENLESEKLIKKIVFDDKMRLTFVAGIEGVGHHAVCAWLKEYAYNDADGTAEMFTRALVSVKSSLVPFVVRCLIPPTPPFPLSLYSTLPSIL